MKRKLLKNRILAGLLALVMVITTWMPTEQVKAGEDNLLLEELGTETQEVETEEQEVGTEEQEVGTEEQEVETEEQEVQLEEQEAETEEQEIQLEAAADVSNASDIQFGQKYSGQITTSVTYAAYSFSLAQSGSLKLDGLSTDMSQVSYVLCDENQKVLMNEKTFKNSTTGWNTISKDTVLTSGKYYLLVGNEFDTKNGSFKGSKSENGTFSFTLNYNVTGESFPETNGGCNNTIETANDISLGTTYNAQIALNDTVDWFKVSLPYSAVLTMDFNVLEGSIGCEIYGKDGKEIECRSSSSVELTKGTYFLRIYSSKTGVYQFVVKAETVNETFEDVDGGTNNTLSDAKAISLGENYIAQIAYNDEVDYFKFSLEEAKKISVVINSLHHHNDNGKYRFNYIIYDSNGNKLWHKYGELDGETYWPSAELEKGTYYFGISKYDFYYDVGVCNFSIRDYQPQPAQITHIEYWDYDGVYLKWNTVYGASGYQIYRKEGDGNYKLIKTIENGKEDDYLDQTAKMGKTYTYKLKTLEGEYSSVDSSEKTIRCGEYEDNVKKYTVKFNANGGKKLSKSSVSVESGKQIGKLPSVQRAGYTLKGWYTKKSGGTKVTSKTKITKNQTLYAQWTKTKKPAAVSKVTLQSSKKGQLAVVCKAVKNAKGYEISYSTSSKFAKKATKTVKTTTGKATIKKLKSGKKYYVRVRAYSVDSTGKKYYSKYSSAKNIKIKK